jgi:hypothetical protein
MEEIWGCWSEFAEAIWSNVWLIEPLQDELTQNPEEGSQFQLASPAFSQPSISSGDE